MPEIITRYPDVTRQVLESAGAQCGRGAPQKILTACPREAFCALPGGEVCVYGVEDIPKMTQLSRKDLCDGAAGKTSLMDTGGPLAAPMLAVAFVVAVVWRRRRP